MSFSNEDLAALRALIGDVLQERLSPLQTKVDEMGVAIVGLRTDMDQRFTRQSASMKLLRKQLDERFARQGQAIKSLRGDMDARFSRQTASLQSLATSVRSDIDSLRSDLESVKRTVNALETVPFPYGRPKTYFNASSTYSVTRDRLTRQGHQG